MTQHAHTTSGEDRSFIEALSDLTPEEEREALAALSDEDALKLIYDWHAWARPKQRLPQGSWTVWLLLSGRGAGKTRTGAESIREWIETKDEPLRIALIAETAADARDVLVEGESGILAISPPWNMPKYEPSKRRLTWPNGSVATLFAGEEPDQLRGPQFHCFVAGTLVTTAEGLVPIEAVKRGMRVRTRDGWHSVTHTQSRIASVGTVRFSNGAALTGTTDHRILTMHGWTRLDTLQTGAIVLCDGTYRQTDTSLRTTVERCIGSTGKSGSQHTGLFHRSTRFITSMGTRQTTRFPTSDAFHQDYIDTSTMRHRDLQVHASTAVAMLRDGDGGSLLSVNRASQGVQNSVERTGRDANTVTKGSNRAEEIFAVNVVSTWAHECVARVYDLTVESQPEFFANSILVHNCAWADELAKYRYVHETFDNLEFGLRLGSNPQIIVTTTPRPLKIIKDLIADPETVVTSESSYANISNLAPKYIRRVIKKYEGTRLGQQELHAKILESAKGALWSTALIDKNRVRSVSRDFLKRVVVSVDPSTTSNEEEGTPNETGITVEGVGADDKLYILKDASKVYSPGEWASQAVALYRLWGADYIIGERNQGGEMVRSTLQTVDPNVPVKLVWASEGKTARAAPVAALTEQGKVKFVGHFAELEDQLTSMMPDRKYLGKGSPDRADSMVWGATELMLLGETTSTDPKDYAVYHVR